MTRRGRRGGLMRSNPRPLIDVLAEDREMTPEMQQTITASTPPLRVTPELTRELMDDMFRLLSEQNLTPQQYEVNRQIAQFILNNRGMRTERMNTRSESAFTPSTRWGYQPEQRRQEQATMTPREAVTAGAILLETGQQQERQASQLLFFCYVTPTGAEISMGKCPHLKREWGRTEGGFEGTSRLQRTEYKVMAPVTIKLVNICTTFGSAKRTVNLFIDLHPDHAAIELHGLENFGMFKGRGKVNLKKSVYKEHSTVHALNDQILKDVFGYTILQPPKATKQGKKVRSLIF